MRVGAAQDLLKNEQDSSAMMWARRELLHLLTRYQENVEQNE